jgi:hypothetical protein
MSQLSGSASRSRSSSASDHNSSLGSDESAEDAFAREPLIVDEHEHDSVRSMWQMFLKLCPLPVVVVAKKKPRKDSPSNSSSSSETSTSDSEEQDANPLEANEGFMRQNVFNQTMSASIPTSRRAPTPMKVAYKSTRAVQAGDIKSKSSGTRGCERVDLSVQIDVGDAHVSTNAKYSIRTTYHTTLCTEAKLAEDALSPCTLDESTIKGARLSKVRVRAGGRAVLLSGKWIE